MIRAFTTYFGIYLFLLLAGASTVAQAQQGDCGQALAHAQQLYDEGKLQQVEPILSKCLKSGFTQEEKIKAYRLLTLAYLYTNEIPLAEEVFVKLLRIAPDFVVQQGKDPVALIELYESYRTSPVLTVSLLLGPNQMSVLPSKTHGVTNTAAEQGSYKGKIGFQVGLGINFYISPRLSIQAQGVSTSRSFIFENTLLGYANLSYTEKQRLLEIPVSLHYHFGKNKVWPYLFGGLKYQHIGSAKADITRRQDVGRDLQVSGLNVSSNRYSQNVELFFGAGVQYRIKRMGLFVQGTFGAGVFQQVIASQRYSIKDLVYRYGYIDDDFVVNHISLQVGVTYSVYNPKKLKNKRFENAKDLEVLPK